MKRVVQQWNRSGCRQKDEYHAALLLKNPKRQKNRKRTIRRPKQKHQERTPLSVHRIHQRFEHHLFHSFILLRHLNMFAQHLNSIRQFYRRMEYAQLLKRARERLPESVFEKERFEIPKVRGHIEGNKTIIGNFGQIANVLRRPSDHFQKYVLK